MTMGYIRSLLIGIVDPFGIFRNFILQPALGTAALFGLYSARHNDTYNSGGNRDSGAAASSMSTNNSSAKDIAIKATFLAFATATIIWASIFMYIAFYYTYMPAIEHIRPVHMQFDFCNYEAMPLSDCHFPHAFVPLTKRQQLLMVGQPYKVYVYIDMPESPVNQELGMFMVCADMRDESTELLDHACRSSMMHYRSSLVRLLRTWLLSPFYVTGIHEEKQQVEIELFANYEEDQAHPVRDVYVEIQSRKIQFYSVTLHIVAHFTGLRYIMFHWPLLSASVGICTNLFFIIIVSVLSWYHWGDAVWIERSVKERLRKRKLSSKKPLETDYSTSVDETNNILDEEDAISLGARRTISNRTDDDDIEELFPEDISPPLAQNQAAVGPPAPLLTGTNDTKKSI